MTAWRPNPDPAGPGRRHRRTGDPPPDADHDGYGDDTRDTCPADPAIHTGACTTDLKTTATTTPPSIAQGDVSTIVATIENAGPGPAIAVTAPSVTPQPPLVELCAVPSLIGKTAKQARQALEKAGCKIGRTTGSKSSKARVRTQTIPKGVQVVAGTKVGIKLLAPKKRR